MSNCVSNSGERGELLSDASRVWMDEGIATHMVGAQVGEGDQVMWTTRAARRSANVYMCALGPWCVSNSVSMTASNSARVILRG